MPIFDQGYQHWHGHLAGHGWRWLAVTRHGVRVGFQNRYLRLVLLGAWVPSFALAGVVCLWGMVEDPSSWAARFLRSFKYLRDLTADPKAYRETAWTIAFHMFMQTELYFSMVVVLLVGPGLISEDLRFNALPLYFSRPLRRLDYFLGKLGVIGFFLSAVTVFPAAAAWILGVLVSRDPSVIADTYRLFLAMIGFGVVVTLSAGLLMLALSSLARNSRFVGALWAGMWLLTFGVSNVMEEVHRHRAERQFFNPHGQLTEVGREMMELERRLHAQPGDPGVQPIRDHAERHLLQMRYDMLRKQRTQLLAQRANEGQSSFEAEQRSDWRPMLSYTGNLQRIGHALLGSRQAWETVDALREASFQMNVPPGDVVFRGRTLSSQMVLHYPWYWSALVLGALGCVSVTILNWQVRSLDRLR